MSKINQSVKAMTGLLSGREAMMYSLEVSHVDVGDCGRGHVLSNCKTECLGISNVIGPASCVRPMRSVIGLGFLTSFERDIRFFFVKS